MQSTTGKPSSLVKPTLETQFHIDYSWWDRPGKDLRTYQLSHFPPDQRERLAQSSNGEMIDFIDPRTGEVRQLDELTMAIQIAAQDPNFINPQASLVDLIFRLFLIHDNEPMTPIELEAILNRPASLILKTLSNRESFNGIRPLK
jgi:hypothetical protein